MPRSFSRIAVPTYIYGLDGINPRLRSRSATSVRASPNASVNERVRRPQLGQMRIEHAVLRVKQFFLHDRGLARREVAPQSV